MQKGGAVMKSSAERYILIYDGQCAFCRQQVARLQRMAPNLSIELRSYHEPGALDAFDALSLETCARAMQLVDPAGNIHAGADAVVHLALRSSRWRRLAALSFIPGVKSLLRWVYSRIAARRLELGPKCDAHCATAAPSDRR